MILVAKDSFFVSNVFRMNEITVKNLELPALQPYRTLRQSVAHRREGIFVAEGEKVVQRLFDSDLEITSVLMTSDWLAKYRHRIEERQEGIDVFIAEKKLLERIVGFSLHQGIMAVGKIPRQVSIEEILSQAHQPYLLVAIDRLTNAENLGVLVRNCAAFGVQALLVGETSSSPYLRRAVRNSMGAVFKLAVIHCSHLTQSLQKIRTQHHMDVVAAHPHAEQKSVSEIDFGRNCCIVFGSEGSGISQEVLAVCSHKTAIPMQNGVDSLNVASASAVLLFEAVRQRRGA